MKVACILNQLQFICFPELSEASKMTLVHQGGKMTEEEANSFESHPQFAALIKMRSWDEKAKVQGLELKPLEEYKEMFQQFLEDTLMKN